MELSSTVHRGLAIVDLGTPDADQVLGQLARAAAPELGMDANNLHEALRRRERLCPTALPEGVALPHAITSLIPRTIVIPMVVPAGVVMDHDQPKSDVIIGLFGNMSTPDHHIRMLARLARIANDPGALTALRGARTPDELVHRLLERDAVHA